MKRVIDLYTKPLNVISLISKSSYFLTNVELTQVMIRLVKAQHAFREALCDSFNTQQALSVLLGLVSKSNIYISQTSNKANVGVLANVARWTTKMLRMFGLGEGPYVEGFIGWGESVLEGQETSGDVIGNLLIKKRPHFLMQAFLA